MTFHPELVDRRRVVHANFFLLSVVPDPHPDVIAASLAPDVVGHLEPDDQDAKVKLASSFSQGMGPQELVKSTLLGVIVRRVVLVLALAFTHF